MNFKKKSMSLIYEKFDESRERREFLFNKLKNDYQKVVLCGFQTEELSVIRLKLKNRGLTNVEVYNNEMKIDKNYFFVFKYNRFLENNDFDLLFSYMQFGYFYFSDEWEEFYSCEVHDIASNVGNLYDILGDEKSWEVVYRLLDVLLKPYEVLNTIDDDMSNTLPIEINKIAVISGKKLWELPLLLKKENPLTELFLKQVNNFEFSYYAE